MPAMAAAFVGRGCTLARAVLTVHHLNHSRSQRLLWLLEELGVPYEIKHYKRLPTMLAPPELLAVHPLGKSPVITDDGNTIAESAVIMEYVLDTYGGGRLRPAPGTAAFQRYRYWLHFAESSIQPQLLVKLHIRAIESAPRPDPAQAIVQVAIEGTKHWTDHNLRLQLDFMEAELNRSAWFAGDEFSAADVQMSFPVEAARERAGLDASRPKLMAFLATIHARPAYRRALERGGSYRFAS
jgi:glutathione S-transferase